MKEKIAWNQIASVTQGGKPYFWIALYKGRKIGTVVWNRLNAKWAVVDERRPFPDGDHRKIAAFVCSDRKGIQYFENFCFGVKA
jgi:hypothetical protein